MVCGVFVFSKIIVRLPILFGQMFVFGLATPPARTLPLSTPLTSDATMAPIEAEGVVGAVDFGSRLLNRGAWPSENNLPLLHAHKADGCTILSLRLLSPLPTSSLGRLVLRRALLACDISFTVDKATSLLAIAHIATELLAIPCTNLLRGDQTARSRVWTALLEFIITFNIQKRSVQL
jgi:hypothetical protein